MTHVTPEALYALLPAVHRIRDAEQGGPLRALFEVLGEQGRLVEEDVARLYDNAFIETCEEWAVPYIGDLLGVRPLHSVRADGFSQRTRVANTIAYRRRKGTATMLEQLARDTTGWPARAVEFFELVATTQHVNHVRLHNHRAPDLRDAAQLELIDTAFDVHAHTADVRSIARDRGRHNLPNVGLFLWRLQAYAVERTEARAVTDPPDGRYRFHPYGIDVPLVNRPQTETEITSLAQEVNVPGRLRRRPLYDELEARRAAFVAGEAPSPVFFGDRPPVEVFLDGADDPLAPEQVLICNLSGWDGAGWSPPAPVALADPDGATLSTQVAVDPVLGRLAMLGGVPVPTSVGARWAYGFPGDVGGGPYDRQDSLDAALTRPATWTRSVGAGADVAALTDALDEWHAQPPGTVGVLALVNNATYAADLVGPTRIRIPEGSLLVIAAATLDADGRPEPLDRRAHLLGDVEVEGTAPTESDTPGTLVLDGLLIESEVRVRGTSAGHHLGGLRIAHSTVGMHEADPRGVRVEAGSSANPELVLDLDHVVCGRVEAPETVRGVRVRDSVVQSDDVALGGADAPGPPATIERSTVFGRVRVRELTLGSDSLFTDPVEADRLQTGCVRFCYVPAGSRTPRRFRCQPDLALRRRSEALELASVAALPPAERERVRRRVRPTFTAVDYGDPAFTQLAASCPDEIRTGAEDGSEMGVWNALRQPQRVANLDASLAEYLRIGLDAGLLFVLFVT
ncbi:hypothetical protein [Rubrivirga sp.]|uniref:hypothetical protein n=1 Tax=Rubrivirga sp. TaxID=1885344 RepID=UPI003B5296E3